jgi:hypothetical protein
VSSAAGREAVAVSDLVSAVAVAGCALLSLRYIIHLSGPSRCKRSSWNFFLMPHKLEFSRNNQPIVDRTEGHPVVMLLQGLTQ